MVVPEHRAHVRIDPEPLPNEFHRHDVVRRMIVLQSLGQGDRIAVDRLDPGDFIALDIVGADENQRADMVLLRILDRDDCSTPFFAAAVSTVFIGSGRPFLFFFSSIVNGRTDCS